MTEDEFSKNIEDIEEINSWFRKQNINLGEGMRKIKEGDDKIKKSRKLLEEFKNEYNSMRPKDQNDSEQDQNK